MKRRPHKLRPNKTTYNPLRFVFWDTEAYLTDVGDGVTRHTFRLGYAVYYEVDQDLNPLTQKETFFYAPEEFVDFLESLCYEKAPLHVIAHNISYDAQLINLPDLLEQRGWEPKSFYVDGQTVIIPFTKGKYKIILEDGLNRLRGSIASLGKLVGLPKLEVDFENVSDEELATYCKRDVEILARATFDFIRFVKKNNFGKVGKTLAAQAFSAFRHRFMRHRIYIHDNEEVIALERAAYKGGLVRVLKVIASSSGPFYKLDVNSMYPHVMLNHRYPTKLIGTLNAPSVGKLERLCHNGAVIARLTVQPKDDCFPYKHKTETIYPKFQYTDVFTTEEVLELISQEAIVQVHEVAVYLSRPIFTDYVETLYALRKQFKAEGNLIYSEICKLLLNGLYGKFGAYNSSWKRAPDFDFLEGTEGYIVDRKTGRMLRYVKWGGKTFVKTKGEESYNSFPAIAAHITANARLYLWNLIRIAGRENVFYSDTDSLIVNQTGYDNLKKFINPSELGKLKLELSADTLLVMARKDYVIGTEVVRKGVKISLTTDNPLDNRKEIWPTLVTYPKRPHDDPYTTTLKHISLTRLIKDGNILQDGTISPFTTLPQTFQSSIPFLMSSPYFQSLTSHQPAPP